MSLGDKIFDLIHKGGHCNAHEASELADQITSLVDKEMEEVRQLVDENVELKKQLAERGELPRLDFAVLNDQMTALQRRVSALEQKGAVYGPVKMPGKGE